MTDIEKLEIVKDICDPIQNIIFLIIRQLQAAPHDQCEILKNVGMNLLGNFVRITTNPEGGIEAFKHNFDEMKEKFDEWTKGCLVKLKESLDNGSYTATIN